MITDLGVPDAGSQRARREKPARLRAKESGLLEGAEHPVLGSIHFERLKNWFTRTTTSTSASYALRRTMQTRPSLAQRSNERGQPTVVSRSHNAFCSQACSA